MRAATSGSCREATAVSVPNPLPEPLRDAEYLTRRISDITATPFRRVVAKLAREHRQPGVTVREALAAQGIAAHVWTDRLVKFYGATDAFLYETTCWNRTRTKQQMRRWIAQFLARRPRGAGKLLVYGDGLGFDSLYFARAGHEVDYCEVSRDAIQFARGMFHDYRATDETPIRVISSEDEVMEGSYDAVVCLDVLEHLPDPGATVSFLASRLAPGGSCIVHAPFWYISATVPTHLASNRKYSGDAKTLFAPHGLVPETGRLFWHPLVLRKGTAGAQSASRSNTITWRTGGLLLSMARFSNVPHLVLFRLLSLGGRDRWKELDELSRGVET